MTAEIASQVSWEITQIRSAIDACTNPEMSNLLSVAMSDAIARKIRMRFLGTGVGRFALSFSKASIMDMFCKSMDRYSKVTAVSGVDARRTQHYACRGTGTVRRR